jgi:hypothetical protein
MKLKILLFAMLAVQLASFAQPTIQSNSFTIVAPDTIKFDGVLASSLATIPALNSGENQTWDFSKLQVDSFWFYNFFGKANNADFPKAQLYKPGTASLGPITIPNNRYFENNGAVLREIGVTNQPIRASVQAITGNIKDSLILPASSQPYIDDIYKFPIKYGDTHTNDYVLNRAFELSVAAFGLNKVPGNVKTTTSHTKSVLGWGKIILRDQKNVGKAIAYTALVQLYNYTVKDSVFLGGAPAPTPLLQAFGLTQGGQTTRYYVEWLVPGFKLLAAQGTLNANNKLRSLFLSKEAGFVAGGTTSVRSELGESIEIKAFPNPSTDGVFTLSFDKNTSKDWLVKIYDMSGREIGQETIIGEGTINHTMRLTQEKGVYFYALFNEQQQFVNNGALIIQ